MRATFALLLLGCLGLPVRADQFDDWCKQVTAPSSIAICSDRELIEITRERQRAYDGARARVGETGAAMLLADQKAWVGSYPRPCGLLSDRPPQLPLPPPVRDCMARAGRDRVAYLTTYGVSASFSRPPSTLTASGSIGPGFDCTKATPPLARLICSDAALSKIDLRFNQAYHALRQVLDSEGRHQLEEEDLEFLNLVRLGCGVPEAGPVAGSAECVAVHYKQKRSELLARLSGTAREEASRDIEYHVALQKNLQRLGYLPPTTNIDGVYGTVTRGAISMWQSTTGRSVTGIMSDADAMALRENAVPVRAGPTGDAEVYEVALRRRGGVFRVPVRINDAITLDFTVDSGASDVLIPTDVLLTLMRTETLSELNSLGKLTYVLADGSNFPSARFNLRELQIGGHRVENVSASIGPQQSEPLLGQSFLSRFKTWAFDNPRQVLILTK